MLKKLIDYYCRIPLGAAVFYVGLFIFALGHDIYTTYQAKHSECNSGVFE